MATKKAVGISSSQVDEFIKAFKDKKCGNCDHAHKSGGNAFYGLGVIGALIFYLTNASSFQEGIVGIVKAILWPAFFVYKLLESFPF